MDAESTDAATGEGVMDDGGQESPPGIKSVDWLDVYCAHGHRAVAEAIEKAARGPGVVVVGADRHDDGDGSSATSHTPPTPPTPRDDGDNGAGGTISPNGGRWPPPRELILPSQAGPRGLVVLERLFKPHETGPDGEGGAWQLRRFGGSWYVYTTPKLGRARWVQMEEEVLRGAVREELEGFWTRKEVQKGEDWVDDKGVGWKHTKFAPTDRVVDDILKAVAHRLAVRTDSVPAWLPPDLDDAGIVRQDRQRWRRDADDAGPIDPGKVIAFRNGLFDVESWCRGTGLEARPAGGVRLLPHGSRWFSMSTLDTDLPVDFLAAHAGDGDEDAMAIAEWLGRKCPAWLEFVGEMSQGDEVWIEGLQRLVGYYMTQDTSLDVIGAIVGLPGTGKGTLVETIEAVVGLENSHRTDLDQLGEKFGVAPLVGKNIAIIPEMHTSAFTNVAASLQRLKSISGGDRQSFRDLFSRAKSSVQLKVKFLLTPNEWPRLPDASAALVRRLVMLPVRYQPARPDPGLSERMRDEREGIRVWALLGLRELWRAVHRQEKAFPTSEGGRELLREVEDSASPMRQFVREECVMAEGNSCTTDCLYEFFKEWREDQGMSGELNKATFGRQLAAATGIRKREARIDGGRTYVYEGIRPRMPEGEERPGLVMREVERRESYLGEDGGFYGRVVTPGRVSPNPSSEQNGEV